MSDLAQNRRRRFALRFALVVGSLLVGLALAEGGLRAVLHLRGTPYGTGEARRYLSEIENRNAKALPLPGRAAAANGGDERVFTVQHPYVAWEADFHAKNLAHDLQRFAERTPRKVRVLVMGGSVAGIFHDLGCPVVAALLKDDPALAGRELEFVCYARGAYKQPQELQYLTFLLSLGVVPDVVLLLDGFNEVAIGNANFERGVHPSWPSEAQWLPLVTSALADPEMVRQRASLQLLQDELVNACKSALRGARLSSALYGEWAIYRVRAIEARFRERTKEYSDAVATLARPELRGPEVPASSQAAVLFAVKQWRECSRLMQILCDARGIRFLHVLQPTLHDPGAKPMSAEELEKGTAQPAWIQGVEGGYPLLRQAGKTLAGEGIAFVDASRIFEGVAETLYYDACHFAERGNELLAAKVAPALAELLAQAAPAPGRDH